MYNIIDKNTMEKFKKIDIIRISGSRLRKYIVRFIFTNPDREFYIQELSRLSGFPASNILNEIKKLYKEGILIQRKIGNIKLYKINKKYFIYEELYSIVKKVNGPIGMARRRCLRFPNIKAFILCGDFAVNKETSKSDLNYIALGNVTKKEILLLTKIIEKRLLRKVIIKHFKLDRKSIDKVLEINDKIVLIDKDNNFNEEFN